MMFGITQEMIVEMLEQRQHIVPAPAGQTQLPPMIVIAGLPAHRDHRIDRRTAADDLAARIIERPPAQTWFGLGLEHPIGARIAKGKQIADRDMEPDPVILAAGFQYQPGGSGLPTGGWPARTPPNRRR